MYKILIIEDDIEIREELKILLQNSGYEVNTITDFNNVENQVFEIDSHLILLDINLPEKSGYEICSKIRAKSKIPIIFVTAKVENIDKITGLSIGADDYITKPFQPLELIARVKAQLRRYKKYNNQDNTINTNEIDFRGIRINNSTHEFFFNEKLVELTKTEFAILWKLCANRGNVVKSDELFSKVWGEKYFERDNNTIMVHIRHLREKMNDGGRNPKYIKTVYGMGYKIEK